MVSAWWADTKDDLPADTKDIFYSSVPPTKAKTTLPPVQKNQSMDGVTLSVKKERASGDEGM
jgi:hypothetical protein